MRSHPVVNVSQIVQYKEQVEGQKKEEAKSIKVEGVKEQEVEKILNKRKIREVEKYLVQQKEFTAEHDSQEQKKNLGNAREVVEKFEGRMSVEVRRQEKIGQNRRKGLQEKRVTKEIYSEDIIWVG